MTLHCMMYPIECLTSVLAVGCTMHHVHIHATQQHKECGAHCVGARFFFFFFFFFFLPAVKCAMAVISLCCYVHVSKTVHESFPEYRHILLTAVQRRV